MMHCDLLLVHPPAYFDIREKMDKIYWPFFSSGGSEPITPLYENFPLGFLSLKDVLTKSNFSVEIINLSTIILTNPNIDLIGYFKNINAAGMYEPAFEGIISVYFSDFGKISLAGILRKYHRNKIVCFHNFLFKLVILNCYVAE